jgi:hypothetical protein
MELYLSSEIPKRGRELHFLQHKKPKIVVSGPQLRGVTGLAIGTHGMFIVAKDGHL